MRFRRMHPLLMRFQAIAAGIASPAEISGLEAWWKTDTGVLADGAAQFTAANLEYLTIADNASLSMAAGSPGTLFSMCGWVYLDAIGVNRPLFGKSDSGLSSANTEYAVYYSHGQLRFRFSVSSGGAIAHVNVGGATPTLGQWYFLAAVYDGTNIKLSLDGGAFATAAHSTGCQDLTKAFRIGTFSNLGSYHDGRVDSVGVWKRALTLAEVGEIYNAGAGKVYADLTAAQKVSLEAWWDLDEISTGAGAVTRNDSQGTNHLTDTATVTSADGIVQGTPVDGDPVGQWTDQHSTKHLVNNTPTARPLYKTNIQNGRAMLLHDGVDDTLIYDSLSSVFTGADNDFTFAAVVKAVSLASTPVLFSAGSTISTTQYRCLYVSAVPNYVFESRDDASVLDTDAGGTPNTTDAHTLIVRFTGTTVSVYVDGVAVISAAAHDLGALTLNSFALACLRRTTNISFFNGYFGEACVYNVAISVANVALLHDYLKARWATP